MRHCLSSFSLSFLSFAAFAALACANTMNAVEEQTVTLKDGRKLTGVYDDSAGTITLNGPARAVIRIPKDDVVTVTQNKTAALIPVTPPVSDERRKPNPLAALDTLIAQTEHDQEEAEANAKDASRKVSEETAASARADSPERKKQYTDRAAQLGLASQRHAAEAQRLTKEIAELKTKRADLAKRQLIDEAKDAAVKAADSFATLGAGDNNSLFAQYRTATDEIAERKARVAQATAELKDAESAQAKLVIQLDQATVLSMDLREYPLQEQAGEKPSDRDRRLGEIKTYNAAMTTLRAAKLDLQAGKTVAVHAPLELLRPEPMRRIHRDKTGRPLVMWDEAVKAVDGGAK